MSTQEQTASQRQSKTIARSRAMAALKICSPFPSTLNAPPTAVITRRKPLASVAPLAAADEDAPPADLDASAESPIAADDPSFEKRLNQIRVKYRSGSGKKAEQRKSRKTPGGGGTKKGNMLLPPVPLREPVAAGGVKVEVGFTPYSERLNGLLAGLGLAAVLLVELGSGQGLVRYHSPAIIFIQIYTIAAAGTLFIKLEKEKISVWPEK